MCIIFHCLEIVILEQTPQHKGNGSQRWGQGGHELLFRNKSDLNTTYNPKNNISLGTSALVNVLTIFNLFLSKCFLTHSLYPSKVGKVVPRNHQFITYPL